MTIPLRRIRVVYPGECAACGRAFDYGDDAFVNNMGSYFCNDECAQLDDDRAQLQGEHEADLGQELYGPSEE